MTKKIGQLKTLGCSKRSLKGEINSNKILLQETRKIPNRQPNSTPKTIGKKRTIKNLKLEGRNHKDPSRNK